MRTPPPWSLAIRQAGTLLRGRRTRQHIKTAGPGLRERPQCRDFGSLRIGPELVECAADKSEMNRAHHLRVLMGCLEQGTTMQLHDAHAGVSTGGEPESLQQTDHRAASGYGTGRPRR